MDTHPPTECDSCGFETNNLHVVEPQKGSQEKTRKHLCTLCWSTPTSTAMLFGNVRPDLSHETLRTICFVGNSIIAAIEASK